MAISEQEASSADLLQVGLEAPIAHPRLRLSELLRASDGDVALRRLLAIGDLAAVVLALGGALILGGRAAPVDRLLWGLLAVPVTILLFKLYGLYDRDGKRITYSTVDDLPRLLHAVIVGGLLLWLYAKLTPMHRLDFAEILAFGVLMLSLTMSIRFAVRAFQSNLVGREPALLIGGGKRAELLSVKLTSHEGFRSKLLGLLDDHDTDPGLSSVPFLGSIEQLEDVVARHGVRRVIVSSDRMDDEHRLEDLLRRCRNLNLKFSLLPKLSDMLGPAVEVEDVEGVMLLGVNPPCLPRSSRAIKRGMDLLLAGGLLILFLPVIAIIVLAIKLDSDGPAIFAQTRVGRHGRRFRVYKFRTMIPDAERRRADLLARSTDPNWLLLDHDPRITRVGHHLRRLSLDELPQLVNVLRGDMSMVGPRPLIEDEDERVLGWARGRLDLTPGLTGYWQVLGRTRIPFEEMVKLDYLYVMNWSLWEDVRLLLRTLPTIIGGRGAN